MLCLAKIPALVPRWMIAVSQLPRWPIVALIVSAAKAGVASADERQCKRCQAFHVTLRFVF